MARKRERSIRDARLRFQVISKLGIDIGEAIKTIGECYLVICRRNISIRNRTARDNRKFQLAVRFRGTYVRARV